MDDKNLTIDKLKEFSDVFNLKLPKQLVKDSLLFVISCFNTVGKGGLIKKKLHSDTVPLGEGGDPYE